MIFQLKCTNVSKPSLFRYEFFLQLKHDILTGRLETPFDTAVQLAAFALQCKWIPAPWYIPAPSLLPLCPLPAPWYLPAPSPCFPPLSAP